VSSTEDSARGGRVERNLFVAGFLVDQTCLQEAQPVGSDLEAIFSLGAVAVRVAAAGFIFQLWATDL
jgi:hypothetical protein